MPVLPGPSLILSSPRLHLRPLQESDVDLVLELFTDPEVMEARFPVIVEELSIRKGSGGAGRWRGGDGATRRIRFREPMAANILANRRRIAPSGLAGGADGAPGRNWIERADGTTEELGATASADLGAGDAFVIETPGGGGYGEAEGD